MRFRSFTRWLRVQDRRDDPIGDLARDYRWEWKLYPEVRVHQHAHEFARHIGFLSRSALVQAAVRTAIAEYRTSEPASYYRVRHHLRARRHTRTPNPRSISAGQRARILERDGFRCQRCGCGPLVRPLEVDHVVAVARGGTRDPGNLQTLCVLCNSGKSDRPATLHDLTPSHRS